MIGGVCVNVKMYVCVCFLPVTRCTCMYVFGFTGGLVSSLIPRVMSSSPALIWCLVIRTPLSWLLYPEKTNSRLSKFRSLWLQNWLIWLLGVVNSRSS